jgi:hypothetical protein
VKPGLVPGREVDLEVRAHNDSVRSDRVYDRVVGRVFEVDFARWSRTETERQWATAPSVTFDERVARGIGGSTCRFCPSLARSDDG